MMVSILGVYSCRAINDSIKKEIKDYMEQEGGIEYLYERQFYNFGEIYTITDVLEERRDV